MGHGELLEMMGKTWHLYFECAKSCMGCKLKWNLNGCILLHTHPTSIKKPRLLASHVSFLKSGLSCALSRTSTIFPSFFFFTRKENQATSIKCNLIFKEREFLLIFFKEHFLKGYCNSYFSLGCFFSFPFYFC